MSAQTTSPRERQQQAINRAMDRAHDAARAGARPVLTATSFDGTAIHETWAVASRSGNGTYAVSLTHSRDDGDDIIQTACTCPAVGICWHRACVRLAHQDAIGFVRQVGYRFRPRVAS